MKIKLTESQLNKAKLITEGQESVHTFLTKADDIKESVNRLFSKVTYTTLSEILEGDVDLDVILRKLEQFRTVMYTHHKKAQDFFDHNMSEKEYYAKWEELHTKVDDTYQDILYRKVDILEDFIQKLIELSKSDIENHFKDIKKIDL